ncbi:MAG: hypothetical protein KAG14_00995 [Mycoplasmataceae bacterium]|nr:hypothetical protein [Mycoplasmataceae bacterium]
MENKARQMSYRMFIISKISFWLFAIIGFAILGLHHFAEINLPHSSQTFYKDIIRISDLDSIEIIVKILFVIAFVFLLIEISSGILILFAKDKKPSDIFFFTILLVPLLSYIIAINNLSKIKVMQTKKETTHSEIKKSSDLNYESEQTKVLDDEDSEVNEVKRQIAIDRKEYDHLLNKGNEQTDEKNILRGKLMAMKIHDGENNFIVPNISKIIDFDSSGLSDSTIRSKLSEMTVKELETFALSRNLHTPAKKVKKDKIINTIMKEMKKPSLT